MITTICLLSACSKAQSSSTDKSDAIIGKNVLIVYLSRTKNTEAIARIIQKNVGGKLVKLELEIPYPENYQANVDQVAKENESGYLPPLKTKIDSMEKYDVVFIGFPTWGMQLPPPMKSFLKQYDFKGKTLIPFNTNAGYGIGSSFQTVKDLAPSSKILDGFSTQGGKERDGIFFVMEGEKEKQAQSEVGKWLQKIGMLIKD
ncbi:flavodoxin [Pedobacter metabolipauper]|uniref:Flavodoxin n=2 Tax=Pedobacter metabolipauper TaxID=425513 RepID=A0A4R6STK6_9SPHI|nr:flavodoxin [Pedobacter metabolipauper]